MPVWVRRGRLDLIRLPSLRRSRWDLTRFRGSVGAAALTRDWLYVAQYRRDRGDYTIHRGRIPR